MSVETPRAQGAEVETKPVKMEIQKPKVSVETPRAQGAKKKQREPQDTVETPISQLSKKQKTEELKLTMLIQNEEKGEMKAKKGDVDTSHVPWRDNQHTLVVETVQCLERICE